MTQVLRQSTAVDVLIGPFVDSTDGYTAETGVSPSVKLSKNGQTLAAKNDITTPVHDADGYYNCELDATDTNTVGTLILTVAGSATSLPVRHEFTVIEEDAYDFLYASGATPDTDIASILADTNELQTDDIPGAIAALNDPTAAAIADAVWDETQAGHTTADTFGALASEIAVIDGNVDAILVDTAEIGAAGAGLTEAGGTGDHLTAVPWNAAWDAEVQSEVTDGLNAYDPPTKAELDAGFAALNDLSAAQVNAEVLDVLNTDTFAEPGQGAPGATISLAAKIGYLYKAWRNRSTVTATEYALYADDATTKDQDATLSDDGTTFDRGEVTTGA